MTRLKSSRTTLSPRMTRTLRKSSREADGFVIGSLESVRAVSMNWRDTFTSQNSIRIVFAHGFLLQPLRHTEFYCLTILHSLRRVLIFIPSHCTTRCHHADS